MTLLRRVALAPVLLALALPCRGAEVPALPGASLRLDSLPGVSGARDPLANPARPAARPALIPREASNGLPVFVESYLTPRLDSRLEPVGRLIPTTDWDRLHRDPATWEGLAAAVEAGSRRAVLAAARGYLIEKSGLDRVGVSISRGPTGTASGYRDGTAAAVRLRLGFSGIVPRMDCVIPSKQGEFRLLLAARGDVTLRYDSGRSHGVSVGADLDPLRGRYGLSLLGRF